jgi:hypothetical protein
MCAPAGLRQALHALVLAQSIRRDAGEAATLIGYAQALELAWKLRREPAPSRFAPQLEAAALPAANHGARCGAESLCRLLEQLEVESRARDESLSALNHEAGSHPIPHDVREIQAALLAGEQSYRDWEYYYARYGERGVRFTRSDSAWLASVARHEKHTAQRQLDWLARLIAARGMPRLLFEGHLEHLHTELLRAAPEHATEYDALLQAAAALKAARASLRTDFEEQAAGFKPRTVPPLAPLTAAEAGRLLLAALLDEEQGLAKAVESLVSWLGDPERFGEHWSDEVERFVHHARTSLPRRRSEPPR